MDALLATSPEFAEQWAAHEVAVRPPDRKRLLQPAVGAVDVDCEILLSSPPTASGSSCSPRRPPRARRNSTWSAAGFGCSAAAYRNDADDADLVRKGATERRIVLTQDRGLLMRRALWAGAYVRGDRPDDQLADVLDRFAPPLAPITP